MIAVGLALLLATAVVLLRLRLRHAERRWQRFVAVWRPVLLGVLINPEPPARLPPLAPADHRRFLRLWAYLHESVRGDAADRLNAVALQLGIDVAARALLVAGSRTEKLLAALAAGYLRDAEAWEALADLARASDSLLSVNAARALVRVDAQRAARTLMPLLLAREDWELGRLEGLLGDARPRLSRLLARTLWRLAPEDRPRALQVVRALRLELPDASLARLLAPDQPAAVLEGALHLASSPMLAGDVARSLDHPDERVRAQAARRMGQVAGRGDVPRLVALLDDPAWPVRMAAAHALGQLPFVSQEMLAGLREAHPQAQAQLAQVEAERAAA